MFFIRLVQRDASSRAAASHRLERLGFYSVLFAVGAFGLSAWHIQRVGGLDVGKPESKEDGQRRSSRAEFNENRIAGNGCWPCTKHRLTEVSARSDSDCVNVFFQHNLPKILVWHAWPKCNSVTTEIQPSLPTRRRFIAWTSEVLRHAASSVYYF